jgi:hypothetical protein
MLAGALVNIREEIPLGPRARILTSNVMDDWASIQASSTSLSNW